MINRNINAKKGIFNSAAGTLQKILFENGKAAYLVVDLENSKLKQEEWYEGIPNRIKIAPI